MVTSADDRTARTLMDAAELLRREPVRVGEAIRRAAGVGEDADRAIAALAAGLRWARVRPDGGTGDRAVVEAWEDTGVSPDVAAGELRYQGTVMACRALRARLASSGA